MSDSPSTPSAESSDNTAPPADAPASSKPAGPRLADIADRRDDEAPEEQGPRPQRGVPNRREDAPDDEDSRGFGPRLPIVREVDPEACTQMDGEEALRRLLDGEPLNGVRVAKLDGKGKRFSKPVKINGCHITDANFQSAVFEDEADFSGTTWAGSTRFGDTFDGLKMSKSWDPARGAHFKAGANFAYSIFKGPLFCAGIIADAPVNFRPSVFEGLVAFPAAVFRDKVWIVRCRLKGWFSVLEARFEGDLADFSSSVFEHDASFNRAEFEKRSSFWGSVFERDASFFRTQLRGEATFVNAHFLGKVDFGKSVHAQPFELRNTDVAGTISLHLAEAPKILLNLGTVRGKLDSENKGQHIAAQNDYGQLKTIFEENNNYRAMDWAYYNFCRARRRAANRPAPVKWLEWLVLDVGSGYGTKPFNIGILMALCIVVFAGIYAVLPGEFLYNVEADSYAAAYPGQPSPTLSALSALYFSVATFTTMGFGDWVAKPDSAMRFIVIIEAFIGLFLVALYVAMLTRKIIR